MKRLITLSVLVLAITYIEPYTLLAQTDSIWYYREQGDILLKDGKYAEAYKALDYCLKNAAYEKYHTETYAQYWQKRSKAYAGIEATLKSLHKKAETALRQGRQDEAYQLCESYLQNCIVPELQNTYPYTFALTQKALFLQRNGKIQEAIDLLNQAVLIRKHGENIDYVHTAETYNYIAAAYGQQGQYNQAIEYCKVALDIYGKCYGKKHEDYATTLCNLSGYYISRNADGDRKYAVELGEEAVNSLARNNPAYALAINNLVFCYSIFGDKVKAQKYSKIAQKTMQKLDQNSMNYASVLCNQAVRLANSSDYVQAVQFAQKAISIFEQNNETQSLNFAQLLFNTASFEKNNEHYSEAIKLWKRASDIYEKKQDKNGSRYLDCMSEISLAYAKMGDLEKAADVNEQLMDNDQLGTKDDLHQAQSLAKRASIMSANGDYKQAILLESKALEIFRYRKEWAEVASSLSDISYYLYRMENPQEAIDTCLAALEIYNNVVNHEIDKSLALNNLSIYYSSQGKCEEALRASQKSVQNFEQANLTESSLFTKVLANMALYEAMLDSLDEAIAISCRADTIQQRLLGKEHPDNVMPTFNRALYHIRKGDLNEGQRLFHKALTQQMSHVRSNFSHLTTRGREMYWGTKRYIFHYAPYVACLIANNDSALIDAYNSLLFTKGILLNSEIDFRKLLSNAVNDEVKEKYNELDAIIQQKEEIWKNPTMENQAQISILDKKARLLEREIVKSCKEFGDFTEAMNIGLSQVKKALPADAAAIEFFDIETKDGDRTYWALLVRPQDIAPHLVRLFNESELNEFADGGKSLRERLAENDGIDSIYNDKRVGQLIWEPLMPYLQGLHSVWFSPSGLFYQFGIEYLNYDGNRLMDYFTLHRVSSTKHIVSNDSNPDIASSNENRNHSNLLKKPVIFGGLDYDATPQQLQIANEKLGHQSYENINAYYAQLSSDEVMTNQKELDRLTRDAFVRDGLNQVKFLKGTEEEAEAISSIFYEQGVDPDGYLGAYGTEEAFKSLEDNCPTLLHMATHGFALSEEQVYKNMSDLAYLGVREDLVNQVDNSLCYAGLLLAGANNTLNTETRGTMPDNMENGILTAREIAQMNLSNLDLVVLSACQTGCGVLLDDGVFGLQRGFKKAGAHTLLMSLWNVDDKATMQMMTSFYNELSRGLSRREAFHAAQNSLRTDPQYSKPRYWASFVMLDD